ncbi:phosphodiester glycosidase family protein [Patescibacteria group bacterium]|nr:phosphodiester glycosidase family protein [Patescibacteria group bacterium]
MKLLKISLITLLLFAGGCVADVEKTPTPFPGAVTDKIQDTPSVNVELPENIDRREVVYSDGRVVNFLVVNLSDDNWYWDFANEPYNAMNVSDWRTHLYADIVINGAYFAEDMQPTGYYKMSGELVGSRSWPATEIQDDKNGYTGMVKVTNGDLSLVYLPDSHQSEPGYDDAVLLTFPTLIANGENQITEDSKKFAHRTILAQDDSGESYIILTESGLPSLYEAAEWLKEQPENFEIAINLDGGNSTGISYSFNDDTLDVSSVPVPNVIFLNKN